MKKLLYLALAAMAIGPAQAKVSLPSFFASNMVMQQQTDVNLWGKATPKSTVTVSPSWDGKKYTATAAADSTWRVSMPTPEAGGPYTISITDKDSKLELENVLLGEVWFCAGQSNMEMPMRGFDRQPLQGGNDVIAKAKSSTPVRMFIADSKDGRWVRQFSKQPKDDLQGEWLTNEPVNVAETSATAYYFARYIQDVLDVPVGIMIVSLGGSMIEPWISREELSKFSNVDFSILDNDEPIKVQQTTPCILYNAKVNPVIGYTIRGMLWYQGESNRDNAEIYDDLMASMVKDYRSRWGQGDFPFYFVEIAPFNYEGPDKFSGALLREAQMRATKKIPNCGMISTLDGGHPVFIHPVDKATVGQRLAWLALGDTYGQKGFGYKSPEYDSMEIAEGKIYINVKNAARGLCPMWTSLEGFEIAGQDGEYHPAFAEIETKTCRLAVSSPDVPEPKNVRYAFKNMTTASVYNVHGLPLHPFRTDNQPLK